MKLLVTNLLGFRYFEEMQIELTVNKYVMICDLRADARGSPRCITNSKGKQRKPGSRDLARAVKSSDPLFLDFIRKSLM